MPNVLVPTISWEKIKECKDKWNIFATDEPAKEREEDIKIKQAYTREVKLSLTSRN